MNGSGKYTVRDFLVYFLTGAFLLIMVAFALRDRLTEISSQPLIQSLNLKDSGQLLTIFFLLPTLYVAGHIVHGLDEFFVFMPTSMLWRFRNYVSALGNRIEKKIGRTKFRLRTRPLLRAFDLILRVIWGCRITGQLDISGKDRETFWLKFATLVSEVKHERAEYWNMMHSLSEGLTFISFAFLLYSIGQGRLTDIIVGAVLTFIFRNRCEKMAENFIATVQRMYSVVSIAAASKKVKQAEAVKEQAEEVQDGG